jgi:ABC-2 type transport system permease protein
LRSLTGTGNVRGFEDLRLIGRQVRYEQLGFWLNPVAAVFTIGFSIVFLVLLSSTAGNSHIAFLGNIRVVEYYVPAFAAYGVMSVCFNNLTISIVVRREMGLLKRVRLSPLPTWVMLAAIFVNAVIISVIQVVVVFLIGRFGYHVALPHHVAALAVALVVGTICFTSIGVATSTLIPNQEAAGPVVSIIFFILLFLSGLWYPIKSGSGLAQVSDYFPVRHMINSTVTAFLARGTSSPWSWNDILVMAIWTVAGIAVSLRRWSWAPRRSDPARRVSSPFSRRG